MTSEPDRDAALKRLGAYQSGGNWMLVCSDGIHRIMCPRCWNGGGGVLDRMQMRGWDDVFLCCDECEALWVEGDFRWDCYTHRLRDFETVLKDERGLGYEDVVELDPAPRNDDQA